MYKKMQVLNILCIVMCILLCLSGCGNKGNSNVIDNESSLADTTTENNKVSSKNNPATEAVALSQKETSTPAEKPQGNQVVKTDL